MRNLAYISGEVIFSVPGGVTIAHDETHKGVTHTQYFEVDVKGNPPEIGDMILVEGSLISHFTEGSGGNKEWKIKIRAEKIEKLDPN